MKSQCWCRPQMSADMLYKTSSKNVFILNRLLINQLLFIYFFTTLLLSNLALPPAYKSFHIQSVEHSSSDVVHHWPNTKAQHSSIRYGFFFSVDINQEFALSDIFNLLLYPCAALGGDFPCCFFSFALFLINGCGNAVYHTDLFTWVWFCYQCYNKASTLLGAWPL